ncbi:MAG TPA: hypothetical protein VGB48_09885 [Allosphingosinicella sp.]|jgi:hypothetical protein
MTRWACLEAERTIALERYQVDGFECRVDYLRDLAEQHDLRLEDIAEHVDLLGPDEDFDGLVVFLEDHSPQIGERR